MKRYRTNTVWPLFLAVFLISGMAHAQNLVTNPGFEGGIGWPWWSNSPSHFFSDDSTFHSGNNSLRAWVPEPASGSVWIAQGVPVIPGESYDIGTWIKTEDVMGPGAQVFIEWSGPSGWLGGEWGAKTINGTQAWQYTGVARVKIPDEATSANVFLAMGAGSTGTAWFDDLLVQKYVKPLLRTFLLRPNYAGKILPGASSPEIQLEITLNPEEHGLLLGNLELKAALKDQVGNPIVEEILQSLSSNSLVVNLYVPADTASGVYDIVIGIYEAENLLAQETYPVEKFSQASLANLTSYIDEHNRFILNGEPFFPLGLYVVQGLSGTAQLDEIANSPFDTLMNYNINNGTDADITNYLNQLQSRDLKLIFSLNGFIGHGQDDIDTITAKVNAFKSHPTVISWYMNDELGLEYLSELEAQYQKVRELDNDHPVWSVHWRKYVLVEEAHTTDILGVDPYPIPAHPITMVSDWADWAEEAGRGYRPLWIVPQIFNWSDYGRAGRPPTREEMRAMTYLAVNHGAKGLIYYSYFNIRDDADYDTRWPQIKGIANEINQLRPVFLSIEQTNNNDIVCDNEDIDFNLMRHNNAYYLFAVNTLNVNITGVSFQINLTNQPEAIETLFEGGRTVPVTDGNFTDDFGSYEVHVYVVNQCTDEDGDMYYSEAGCGPEVDCNDFDSSINPGACDVKGDGIDQDCDGQDRTRGRPCTAGGDDGGEPDGIEGRGKTCSDSIDNDSDGLIDCDDPDCFKKKSCR